MRYSFVLGFLVVMLLMAFPVAAQDDVEESASSDQVVHVVQYGETLYRIALRYGVSVDEIVSANSLPNSWRILVGQELVIPGLTVPDSSDVVENPLIAGAPTTYIIQPGDTLRSIADRYELTVDQLMLANNITNPDLIMRGQELKVWTTESVSEPVEEVIEAEAAQIAETETEDTTVEAEAETAPLTIHVVQPGETLGRIGMRYGVSWQDIAALNSIVNTDHIYSGQQLYIPGEGSLPAENSPVLRDPGITTDLESYPEPLNDEKHIIVDLSDSRVYAYEDGELVYSVLGSMGLPATPTVVGDFKIYHRYDAQTMSGPGYYLPGVQWVQYFYQGYALHGAYWHNNWGQPMSHGCVNLPNDAALWLYNFADVGTTVRVQQ